MSLFAVLIGLLLPALSGTLLLLLLEGRTRVLLNIERIALGWAMGLLLTMELTFGAHLMLQLPLAFPLFMGVQVASFLLVGITAMIQHRLHREHLVHLPFPDRPARRSIMIILSLLVAWVTMKALLLGTVSLMLTPSFFDDTLSNWNLRGKVFYVTQAYTLVMPNEDPATSPLGVSSYPPTVPLAKVWLAILDGQWSDGVVNSIHIVWYFCALILVYSVIRRQTSRAWGLLGVYILGSMPLFLMHGTSAYADAFLSVHIFAALSMLFSAVRTESSEARLAYLRIGALATALLPFTKNEGLMVHLPPLLLLVICSLCWMHWKGLLTKRDVMHSAAWYIGCLLIFAAPWLIFKLAHGLTFGNGKPFTSLGFAWQHWVIFAIIVNTFFEGNWLLLFPLFLTLLVWRWKKAFSDLAVLTTFFLIVYVGQGLLYLFTQLSTEALRQTGYARGLVQLMPLIVTLAVLLLRDGISHLGFAKYEEKMNDHPISPASEPINL